MFAKQLTEALGRAGVNDQKARDRERLCRAGDVVRLDRESGAVPGMLRERSQFIVVDAERPGEEIDVAAELVLEQFAGVREL